MPSSLARNSRLETRHSPTTIITGAASGIGRAIAAQQLRAGHRVLIADRDRSGGEDAVAELSELGEVAFQATDVGDEAQVAAMAAAAIERWGRIDGLVANAGFGRGGAPERLALADWNAVLQTNLTGTFLCARACIPALRERKGAIVTIASTRAHMSEPESEAYAASKGGIVALTHALAASLSGTVRVNCISPGWIATEPWRPRDQRGEPDLDADDHAQHFAGRVGRPEDVAEMAAFLLDGERSGFMSGAELVCDGGMTRKMIYR